MSVITLKLSLEASQVASEFAKDLNITPDEAASRIVEGFGSMFKTVISEQSQDVQPSQPVASTAKSQRTYSLTIDDVTIEATNSPEWIINFVKHLTPKKIYSVLVANNMDTQLTAIVKTTDVGNPKDHRKIEVDGFTWYVHVPTGYKNATYKIQTIANLFNKEVVIHE